MVRAQFWILSLTWILQSKNMYPFRYSSWRRQEKLWHERGTKAFGIVALSTIHQGLTWLRWRIERYRADDILDQCFNQSLYYDKCMYVDEKCADSFQNAKFCSQRVASFRARFLFNLCLCLRPYALLVVASYLVVYMYSVRRGPYFQFLRRSSVRHWVWKINRAHKRTLRNLLQSQLLVVFLQGKGWFNLILSSANSFWTKVPTAFSQCLPPSSSGKRRRDRISDKDPSPECTSLKVL